MMRSREVRQSLRLASVAADAAVKRYPLRVVDRKLLRHTHNTTYRLTLENEEFAVLKISRPSDGHGDGRELLSEMQRLDALSRQTDLLIPRPIRNRAGELVTDVNSHRCRVMSWVPWRRLSRGMKPKHFAVLGELIASLHEHAGRFRPPRGFVRLRWDEELERRFAHVTAAGRSGRIDRKRMKVFDASLGRAQRAARRLGRGKDVYRLIHADLGYSNHLFHRGRAGAIDFEACGYGYLLHDLAEPLVFAQHVKHFPALRDALIRGYRRVRPMSVEIVGLLPDFIDFSAMTSLGYICGERSRARDLRPISGYLAKVLRPAQEAVAK